MAKVLDARAAAQEIRGKMKQPSAEDRHMMFYVGRVLDELGLEHDAVNSIMVAHALHDADIQPHQIVEYPKAVTVKVTNEKKYGDDKEHDEVYVVNSEDEEHDLLDKKEPGPVALPEYPKAIRVRGTDGTMRTQMARDLKEERELLGVGASAIDPEASTQYKKAQLEPPTEQEVGAAKVTSRGGEMQKQALDDVNEPKVGAGTNLPNAPDEQVEGDEDYGSADEPEPDPVPEPPKPAPAPVRAGPRPPPKRA